MSKIICLLGLSGCGKDTVKRHLPFPYIISYRTRPMRNGEQHGVDGYFVSEKEYLEAKESGNIVDDTFYDKHHYWTMREQYTLYLFSENPTPIVSVIDGRGIINLVKAFGENRVCSFWLDVPQDELIKRMMIRGQSKEEIEKRITFHQCLLKDKNLCDYIIDATKSIDDICQEILTILEEEGVFYDKSRERNFSFKREKFFRA